MDCIEAIHSRRAVRNYSDRAVDPTTIQELVDCAVLAPSAGNMEPWAFSVFLEREFIEEMAREAKEWLFRSALHEPFTSPFYEVLRDPDYTVFYHAPALVLVAAQSHMQQAAEDCCLAAENLMLAARSLGVGSCWVGLTRPWFNLEATKEKLSIPEEHVVVAPIVLGYPKTWPPAPGRKQMQIRWCVLPENPAYSG